MATALSLRGGPLASASRTGARVDGAVNRVRPFLPLRAPHQRPPPPRRVVASSSAAAAPSPVPGGDGSGAAAAAQQQQQQQPGGPEPPAVPELQITGALSRGCWLGRCTDPLRVDTLWQCMMHGSTRNAAGAPLHAADAQLAAGRCRRPTPCQHSYPHLANTATSRSPLALRSLPLCHVLCAAGRWPAVPGAAALLHRRYRVSESRGQGAWQRVLGTSKGQRHASSKRGRPVLHASVG